MVVSVKPALVILAGAVLPVLLARFAISAAEIAAAAAIPLAGIAVGLAAAVSADIATILPAPTGVIILPPTAALPPVLLIGRSIGAVRLILTPATAGIATGITAGVALQPVATAIGLAKIAAVVAHAAGVAAALAVQVVVGGIAGVEIFIRRKTAGGPLRLRAIIARP